MAKKSTTRKVGSASGGVSRKRSAGASAGISGGSTDRQLDALLALLADSPMLVISGAKIAREIGVTRSTVWRWVTTLRALGVHVKGHPRSGYHIERVPDLLVPVLLSRVLQGTAHAKRIHHYFKVDSTNRVAMELGQQGEPHGAGGTWKNRAQLAFGEIERHLLDDSAATAAYAGAGSGADAGGGSFGSRCYCRAGRLGQRQPENGSALAE
jgi:biotin operon repressor